MSRIILSSKECGGKTIEVTPEAINKFSLEPLRLRTSTGMCRQINLKFNASVDKEAPVEVIATYDKIVDDKKTSFVYKEEIDERRFAENMFNTIVRNSEDVNNMSLLCDAVEMLTRKITYDFWKKEKLIFADLLLQGFGYIEIEKEIVAVTDSIDFRPNYVRAEKCIDIRAHTNFEKSQLHFLPKGESKFLLLHYADSPLNDDVGEPCFYIDSNQFESANEVLVGEAPKTLNEYESEDSYLKAVAEYLEKHLGISNSRKIELEDDLIF